MIRVMIISLILCLLGLGLHSLGHNWGIGVVSAGIGLGAFFLLIKLADWLLDNLNNKP
jgi:hypothetical protein